MTTQDEPRWASFHDVVERITAPVVNGVVAEVDKGTEAVGRAVASLGQQVSDLRAATSTAGLDAEDAGRKLLRKVTALEIALHDLREELATTRAEVVAATADDRGEERIRTVEERITRAVGATAEAADAVLRRIAELGGRVDRVVFAVQATEDAQVRHAEAAQRITSQIARQVRVMELRLFCGLVGLGVLLVLLTALT